ncbi:hsp70 family chaperone [Grosmannia clavigera kw1407]|uniref:Hsp70 family chaperone n=1 Tax=Grosmannia clavigera (strain kw1407 / UAMH 11150) TaxID=655863 RepID=F0XCL6_GROCL|nr:hsp70 family chaperone [Grosmannia clavigera kw1407]EFX04491.1 hsp70 family chaperone [Grosmannia clavigera kw1407]
MPLEPSSADYWQGVPDDRGNVLIIGIDFGTTYSGVAWATPYDFEQEQINLIHSWPGMGLEKGKAPTELCYEDGQVYWGYEVPADADAVQWFKLLLLREDDLSPALANSEHVRRCRRMLHDQAKTPVDLVADYLRLLWAHVLDTISRDRGDAAVAGMRLHVVLTVPAIWPGYARQRMEEAVSQAGILDARPAGPTELTLVTEPEAAALATLYNSATACRQGDVVIICDAGGGTVDLVSYKVTRRSPLVIEEAIEGVGGLFGSIFVDEAFEHMSQRRLGPKWDSLSKAGVKELVRGEWQQVIKPQYKHMANSRRQYTVGIPAEAFASKAELNDVSREPHIKMGRFHLTGDQIEKLFEYSFDGIDRLIDEQISAIKATKDLSVSDIILVGGLGGSPYLHQHLKERHGSDINVLQSTGTKPWTAICRGAVYKGCYKTFVAGGEGYRPLPVTVASTVSRFSVGLCFSQLYSEAYHREEDRYYDEKEGVYFAGRQMEWYLRKGSSVQAMTPIRHDFYLLVNGPKTEWTRELYLCNSADAPSRKGDGVEKMCDLTCNFASIVDRLPYYESPSGQIFKKFAYEIVMIPSGASVEFAVLYQDQRLASKEVKQADFWLRCDSLISNRTCDNAVAYPEAIATELRQFQPSHGSQLSPQHPALR